MSEPLLVLDTNVVLDLMYFDDPVARPLRLALEGGRVRCTVSDATLGEWRRVLAYTEFGLEALRQDALFERYQSLATRVEVDVLLPTLPRCKDPDDQKFLELAAAADAQGLVSKDRAVLKLRRRCAPQLRIMTPAEAVCWLESRSA